MQLLNFHIQKLKSLARSYTKCTDFEISGQGQRTSYGTLLCILSQGYFIHIKLFGHSRIQYTSHCALFPHNRTNESEEAFFSEFLPLATVGHTSVSKAI